MKKVTSKKMNKDIYFKVFKGEDGWYVASGIGISIFTQGKTLDSLYKNIKEAVALHMEALAVLRNVPINKPSIFMKFQPRVSA